MRTLIPLTSETLVIAACHLSELSQRELARAGVEPEDVIKNVLKMARDGTAYAMFYDTRLAAIAGTKPEGGVRMTWCLATSPFDWTTAKIIGMWAKLEQKAFPTAKFQAVSYSDHPQRDRFFKFLGMHKSMEIKGAAVFDLPPL